MRLRSVVPGVALAAMLATGCDQVTLSLPDQAVNDAASVDGSPAGPAPEIDKIAEGLPIPVRGGGAQFVITGQHLLDNDGQIAVDALLNDRPANLRLLAGQITVVTDAQTLTRAELGGVAELRVRSRNQPTLQSASKLFRYYVADTPTFRQGSVPASSVAPLAVGDVDGDGQLDRVEASNFSLVFKLSGPDKVSDIATAGDALLAVALADLNDDRRLDVVAVYRSGANHSAVVFLRREGAPPAFDMAATLSLGGGGPATTAGIAVADLNGDGRSDLTFTLYTQGRATPYSTVTFTGDAR